MAGQEVKAGIKPDIMRQCTDTSGNILSDYLSPSKEQEGVAADNEVTVAYEVYGRCAQRYSESWKVGEKDIKFAKKAHNTHAQTRDQLPTDIIQSYSMEGIDESDRDVIEFIKEIMAEEHSVKSDMISVLKQQISVLKEELFRKQTIIEKLLRTPRGPCTQCQFGIPGYNPVNNTPGNFPGNFPASWGSNQLNSPVNSVGSASNVSSRSSVSPNIKVKCGNSQLG